MGINSNYEEDWWTENTQSSDILRYFDPKDLTVEIRNEVVMQLLDQVSSGEIDLLPEFQRSVGLWSEETKSQLVESLLLNFPIPPFYFDSNYHGKRIVIDGLQRLWSLNKFISENGFKLKGLVVLRELNGLRFSELERQYQRRILQYSFVTYNIKPGAPRFVIYDIFRRLNTGGTILNPQEVRHALNPGASILIQRLANERVFKDMIKLNNKRMQNHELVLRFVSFYLNDLRNYDPPLSSYLDLTMERLNSIDAMKADRMVDDFRSSLTFIASHSGKDLFSKSFVSQGGQKMNKALFEVWSVLLAKLSDSERQSLSRSYGEMISMYRLLQNNEEFLTSITTAIASKKAVHVRFSNIDQIIRQFL